MEQSEKIYNHAHLFENFR